MVEDLSAHARELASGLLEDIELSRTSLSQQVLKASRLARLIGDEEAVVWIEFELSGIRGTDSGNVHMTKTKRWIKEDENRGLWGATTADLEGQVESLRDNMEASRVDSFSGDALMGATIQHRKYQTSITEAIGRKMLILNRVRSLLHEFARRTYYELEFSAEQQSLFDSARKEIDGLLAPQVGESLDKIDSIYRRLSEGDPESISQAMNTVRRLIDSFADAVYPAVPDGSAKIGDQELKAGQSQVLNRIDLFVADHTESESRRKRLRQSLRSIYERASAGSHAEVTPAEARYLFLSTYVLLGEILTLSK